MQLNFFGTDGIRGPFGTFPITAEFASKLGWAFGTWLLQTNPHSQKTVVLGQDTRASGQILKEALAAGLQAAGVISFDAQVIPTPAIARCVLTESHSGGIAITASHNPASDNGIKLFNHQGLKLTQKEEAQIEALIQNGKNSEHTHSSILKPSKALELYETFAQSIIPKGSLNGLKLVIDTANGATCRTTPALLAYAGAEIILIGNTPDGSNINQGVGSEYPQSLAKAVLQNKAHGGLAHDGDGDRLVVVDETGDTIPGEAILAALAIQGFKNSNWPEKTIVTTIQSNLGLDAAIQQAGGKVFRTPVGDRFVLHKMLETNSYLGGESSGHFILREAALCGDGLIAALSLLNFVTQNGQSLSTITKTTPLFPQKTAALAVREKQPLESLPGLQKAICEAEKALGENGRTLIRYSGTENKLRFLVEGPTEKQATEILSVLLDAAQKELA